MKNNGKREHERLVLQPKLIMKMMPLEIGISIPIGNGIETGANFIKNLKI